MNTLFKENRKKLLNSLPENSLVFLFSASRKHRNGDQFFPFRQDSSFYYFTGIEQYHSIFVLFKNKKSQVREILFIYHPTEKEITYDGNFLDEKKARKISSITEVQSIDSFERTWKEIMDKEPDIYTFLPEDDIFKNHLFFKGFHETLQKFFPITSIHDITPIIKELRTIKEPEEIENIHKAIAITKSAYEQLFAKLRTGTTERELLATLLFAYNSHPSTSYSFDPIVAAGKNACTLHYNKHDTKIKKDDILLVDTGAEYFNYAADITRTFPVSGRFSDKQKFVYQAVLDVQKKAISLFVLGNTINKINEQVDKWMEEALIEIGLVTGQAIKNQPEGKPLLKKYYPHGVTHFMGLDVHDVGDKDTPLQKGMVLTCEPGLYIPEWEIGIRIEDDILVDDSPIVLSADIPKEIHEVEAWMEKR